MLQSLRTERHVLSRFGCFVKEPGLCPGLCGFTEKRFKNRSNTPQADMDEKDKQKNTVFDRLSPITCEHVKPPSKNSVMMECEQKAGLHQIGTLPHPFVDFKIEVLNNCQKKRKSDATATNGVYETPAKKVFSPNALSPDLGCVMDFSTPTTRQDSFYHFATSKFSLGDSSQTVNGEIKENMSSQQQSQQVKCGLSADPGNIKVTVPHSLKSEEVPSDPAPEFDCDVDDILCLNPAGASTAVGFSANVESCTFPSGHTLKKSPVNLSVGHGQKLEKGHWQVDEQEEQNKGTGKYREEDKGYFSGSYIKDLELGKNLSQSGYSQLPFVTSSPQLGVLKAPEDESQPESSTEQDCSKQAKPSVKDVSFTDRDFCPILSGPQLSSTNLPEELLEEDVDEEWNIGQPIFESSLCQKIEVKLDGHDEQVSEKLEGNVTEPIHECQATLDSEETTLETSYETTILPFVKVKSVVIAPSQPTFNSKLSSCSELNVNSSKPGQKRNRGFQPARFISSAWSPRPEIFKTKADLEHEKQLYVHSVTRHVNERPAADEVTELRNLMTHVADQITGPHPHWQHPSDLTRRNYKKRVGNVKPNMSLVEWQAENSTTHKRFSRIPKIFERSEFL